MEAARAFSVFSGIVFMIGVVGSIVTVWLMPFINPKKSLKWIGQSVIFFHVALIVGFVLMMISALLVSALSA